MDFKPIAASQKEGEHDDESSLEDQDKQGETSIVDLSTPKRKIVVELGLVRGLAPVRTVNDAMK